MRRETVVSVGACYECPWVKRRAITPTTSGMFCGLVWDSKATYAREIEKSDRESIPDWCPLPEVGYFEKLEASDA